MSRSKTKNNANREHSADNSAGNSDEQFILVQSLSNTYYLRKLDQLLHVFSAYHIDPLPIPSVWSLAKSGYKAVVCAEYDKEHGRSAWKSALIFRIVRERRAIWHTIIQVDYVAIDPSRPQPFSSMGDSLRILSQYVEKRSRAMRLDLLVSLDAQMNASIFLHARRSLLMEGLMEMPEGMMFMKRLRDIDPKTGRNSVLSPLPKMSHSAVMGMDAKVQSSIMPRRRSNGGLLTFIGRVRKSGADYEDILSFCSKHAQWEHPRLDSRVSYMQSYYPSDVIADDARDYVDSLCRDAQFLKLSNPKGDTVALLSMVAGYSTPALTPSDKEWVDPERVVFVPLLMCQTGEHRKWTRTGFAQAQELYNEMFSILQSEDNEGRYDIVSCMVAEGTVHAALLRKVGFSRISTVRTSGDDDTVISYYTIRI